MRVLFTSTAGPGHIHPMLPLARAFMARGDDVLWALPSQASSHVAAEGIATEPCGLDLDEAARRLGDPWAGLWHLPVEQRPEFAFARIFGATRTGPTLADLVPLVDRWSPSIIVRDLAEFAAPIAAAIAGIPCITHSFGEAQSVPKLTRVGDEVASLWERYGLEARPFGGTADHLYLDIYPPALRTADRSHLGTTHGIRSVQAASNSAPPDLPFDGSDGRPLIYVTFGTILRDITMFAGVVAAVGELDAKVVATVGPQNDPSALGPQPDNVHVARYIPQDQLLAHCAAVVSHAGSGTFLAAIANGLPQLCLPQAADQFMNAAACERVQCGLVLRPDDASHDRIRDALDCVITDSRFAEGATAVGRDIAAMPSPQAVADLLADRYR